MAALTRALRALFVLSGSLLLTGCHTMRPGSLGPRDGRLADCPETPNCVSSQARDEAHRVAPFPLAGTGAAAIERLAGLVRSLPRARVVAATDTYLRAEFRSAVFRFVDDAEFLVDEAAGVIHVRSAARAGYNDLGVNRRRIEVIRARWDAEPER